MWNQILNIYFNSIFYQFPFLQQQNKYILSSVLVRMVHFFSIGLANEEASIRMVHKLHQHDFQTRVSAEG